MTAGAAGAAAPAAAAGAPRTSESAPERRARGRPAARSRRLRPAWRSAWVSAHVVSSVGWLGVHGGVLALAATGLAAESPGAAADAYAGAAQLVRLLVLPLSLTALVTGLVLALGTPWGLFRHYWVALKLVFTALLVAGSNLSLGPMVLDLAAATADGTVLPPDLERARPVIALSVALTLLLASTLLSTVKPFGRIRRGTPAG